MKVIKVCSSQGTLGKNVGCEKAPDKILEELKKIHLTEGGRSPSFEVEDVEVVSKNFEETNIKIYEKIRSVEEPAVIVGGDHSITFSAFKAFAEKNANAGIVIFDAHPDCVNNFKPPSHEDYLKVLLEERILKKENVVLVGIRDWSLNEFAYLRKNNIKFYSMKEIFEEGAHETCDNIMSVARQWGSLYVSVDVDVVDPAFAPATGHHSPGGMSSREILYFLHRLKKLNNLKIFDLVEINPELDKTGTTVKLGAKLLKEMML